MVRSFNKFNYRVEFTQDRKNPDDSPGVSSVGLYLWLRINEEKWYPLPNVSGSSDFSYSQCLFNLLEEASSIEDMEYVVESIKEDLNKYMNE